MRVRTAAAAMSVAAVMTALAGRPASAQSSLAGDTIHITRTAGSITIDGDLSDAPWRSATRVEKFYEIEPGDNIEPPVKSVGFLTYDDRFLYVAFEFEDPQPSTIHAPLGDHDSIGGDTTDFGGLFVDSLGTGRTAIELFVTPRNIQFDAVTEDGGSENASPDFFWDSATRITGQGWTAEMRIPFSSLRYTSADLQSWGVILLRNYPRGFRHIFSSARMPRGNNCTVCHANRLEGLEHLPSSRHLVAAPYVNAGQAAHPRGDQLGAPLVAGSLRSQVGVDLKLVPNANDALDVTVKPDFSQVESDTAQISANERFALFFPEKRPFFLEGVDLLQTPIQAVYTRTITSPVWGGRMTGKEAGLRYTAFVVDDEGGGSVVIPGPNESSLANQDVGSTVFVGRVKREMGLSFLGALMTDIEAADGNGRNRVVGPDFQWRLSESDFVSGQWLLSDTQTPSQPDVADEWTGQTLTGAAGILQWNHSTRHLDGSAVYRDIGRGFRANAGFVPQVGYHEGGGEIGWNARPTGLLSQQRTFANIKYQAEPSGAVITRDVESGINLNSRWNSFLQFRYIDNRTRAGDSVISRRQFGYTVNLNPSLFLKRVSVSGTLGEDIDFANARPATGATTNIGVTLDPTVHLELDLLENDRVLNVSDPDGVDRRLLSQRVSRMKATYTFTARTFIRVIGQYVSTTTDPSLYVSRIAAKSGQFSGSALFAYKLNWQSVIFAGYGDDRELTDERRLAGLDRQFFVKVSYAFQR
jgi:Domain of unknown function (DUF5916)